MSNRLQNGVPYGDVDMQSLLEKVRLLEMENQRLKEKKTTTTDEVYVAQSSVKFEIPAQKQSGKLQSQIIPCTGKVKLQLHAEMSDTNQMFLSFEIQSSVEIETTIIMTSQMNDPYRGGQVQNTFVEFLRSSAHSARGSSHIVNLPQRGGYHGQVTVLTIGVKIINMASVSNPPDNNATATVVIQNQKLSVDIPYLSKWSQFLQGYFSSNMKERAAGIYPINDCSLADFHEMLEVIYPSSKPIDENNVEAMLDLADRFIMPMLTRKCEIFLSKNDSHGISEIRMLAMADKFNLIRTRTIVLERLGSTALLRSKILQVAGYNTLSKEMKIEVDARYVQLDVQERKGR